MARKEEQLKLEDFTAVVGGKPQATPTRLAALGHYEVCSRCGGCGRYSWCQQYGDRCFECAGSGKVLPKLTTRLLETVKAQMARGELKPYLEKLQRARDAKAMAKKWFDTWRGLPSQVAVDEWKKEHGKEGWQWSSYRQLWQNAYCAKLSDEKLNAELAVEHGKTAEEREAGIARLRLLCGLLERAEERVPPHLGWDVSHDHPDSMAVMADGKRTAVADMMVPQVTRALVPYGAYGTMVTPIMKAKKTEARPRLSR